MSPSATPSRRVLLRLPALLAGLALLCSCTTRADRIAAVPWRDSGQAVVVVVADWNSQRGTLHAYERNGTAWREALPAHEVMVGRSGSAWGLGLHPAMGEGPVKREGDGRSPAGVFSIGHAFGYAGSATTALPYDAMRGSHYCMDVPASPLYNRIVDADVVGAAAVAGSTEPMRLDLHSAGDPRYKLGFVIGHNTAARANAGSCIFAHLRRSDTEPTAGCTSMDEPRMQALLGWLRPEARPVFVLMPEADYRRLQAGWHLPPIGSAP